MRHLLLPLVILLTACGDDDASMMQATPDAQPDAEEAVDAGPMGNKGMDEECSASECAEGLACGGSLGGSFDDPYTCQIRVENCVGDPCGPDAVCQWMHWNEDPIQYTCAPRLPLGAVCQRGGDKDINVCVDGATCQDALPDDDRCVAAVPQEKLVQGASCNPNQDLCETGLFCDWNRNTFTGQCNPRKGLDGACTDQDDECGSGLRCVYPAGLTCESWLSCAVDGKQNHQCCATPTGAECVPNATANDCPEPTGTCVVDAGL